MIAQTEMTFEGKGNPESVRNKFPKFNAWLDTPNGGEVMNAFIRVSLSLKNHHGFKQSGANFVRERIRWQFAIESKDDRGFKICNDWTPLLARYAEEKVPELIGFFRMKKLKKEKIRHKN